jgi:mannose/cellobiose epimerase-like protein (N-acyl-D-glucosamine 2-epimerase family)
MQKSITIIIALLCIGYIIFSMLTFSEHKPGDAEFKVYMDPAYWKKQALDGIIPFWEKTVDSNNGGFYNDVMYDGTPDTTNGKYPMNISELVYGFSAAYMLSGEDKYLEYAGLALGFLTNYCWDRVNGGWKTFLDTNKQPDTNIYFPSLYVKPLVAQSHCNLGPVFYYMATGDRGVLAYVKRTHELIRTHAWDPLYKGYYSEISTNWLVSTVMKSVNAQIDISSAYLIYYYLASRDRRLLPDLENIADVARDHMTDPDTGFVGERFYNYWKSVETNLSTGDNLQAAWVLMRTYNLTKLRKYASSAENIAQVQISNNWDPRYYGWFSRFNFTNSSLNNESKSCFVQAEGDSLMLALYRYHHKQEYLDTFGKCAWFWDKYIVDHKYGECYIGASRDGMYHSNVKGNIFKSACHTKGRLSVFQDRLVKNGREALRYADGRPGCFY